jgi:tetratricopeptide (TPR) repeat protein
MTVGQTNPGADLAALEQELAAARAAGDPAGLAEALARHANALVLRGQLRAARDEIDEAVALYQQLERREDEARYGLLAATLTRLLREFSQARARVEASQKLTQPGSPTQTAAVIELGEIALAEGNYAEAADALQRALSGNLDARKRLELLRKRANALAALQRYAEASEDLTKARELALEVGDQQTASVIAVEQVTVLQQSPDQDSADAVRSEQIEAARQADDHFALAQLYILEATRSIEQRKPEAARSALEEARSQALQARAPIPYMTAAIALAELADSQQDRIGAYESLAKAWATLSDVLGAEAAKAAIQPKLQALQNKWGNDAFAAVRADYEAKRRAELGRGT